ncbi:rhomboid family intramembrane serine protease [Maritimibacter sp. UBA3975]|uniref:rhomboid family intramembrane serine protease n=1 Tax=Maritimibacter sp. UBA3975 TaxID=1946833 RepID=UPI000C092600|nr:rhomboid family intramembrane serine protease [Maritimibacter sp. UBA3975]MAM61460.1 rhomboid family intramembrane serine protease [Maritimibacter sp.]|tara:strand:+ start:6045 stop:6785 length:741 start_codon:yes stop_codon:yes gene_type:complete
MFPIRDHNPSERTPYVTYVLVIANIVVFLAQLSLTDRGLAEYFWTWGVVPDRVTAGIGLETVFTSMFIHSGFMHILGNMLFLWIFGDNLEDELGHVGFLIFYLAAGIGAAAAQIMANPASQVPMVGASGAIAGVMGGYLLLFPKARVDVLFIFIIIFKVFPMPAWIMLGIWFGLQVFNGASTPGDGGGVAYLAHVGGFVVGFLWVLPKWLREGGPEFWRRTHGHPPHPDATYRLGTSNVPRVGRRR